MLISASLTVRGLNRTFYGIETSVRDDFSAVTYVLIVPFMELKQSMLIGNTCYRGRLNRTFYGIETNHTSECHLMFRVLIVPFMELKHCHSRLFCYFCGVLIVPFMELKLQSRMMSVSGIAS